MTKFKIGFLYRDAGNWKTRFDHIVDDTKFPEVKNLEVNAEVTMGEFGTLDQDNFFESEIHPHSFRESDDHNILEVEEIQQVN